MRRIEPQIIKQTKYGKTGLYKADVVYQDLDDDDIQDETEYRKTYIVKYLPLIDTSISSLIKINPVLTEAFINKTFKNPFLNTAEHVCIQSGVIVLYFKELSGNFHSAKRLRWNTIKYWIKCMLNGLAHLHLHRIIHGDITASNIMIDDNQAKLSDFGSSALILTTGNQKFYTKMYTPTHRPPEVWTDKYWNLSADIWSAGCTIYEMVYGEPLFKPKQTETEYLLQLDSWLNGNQNSYIQLSPEWNNPEYSEINRIIISMLNGFSEKRPTVFDILKDPLFNSPESLSGSPDFNCSYISLDVCPIIPHRVYDESNFKRKDLLTKLLRSINPREQNNEIKMLLLCMYESIVDSNEFDIKLIRILLIVIYLISHRCKPAIFTLTIEDKEAILNYCNQCQFNFINWTKFYGVYDRFYIHLNM